LPDHFSLERFFDYAIDMLCVADASGYFLKVNRAFERVMGYSREELLERPFVEFVHPDDRPDTIAETKRLSTGQRTSGENRSNKDATWKLISWTVPDPAGPDVRGWPGTTEAAAEDRLDGITRIPTGVFDEMPRMRRACVAGAAARRGLLDVDHLTRSTGRGTLGRLRSAASLRRCPAQLQGGDVARHNGGTFGVPFRPGGQAARPICDSCAARWRL
jgi:PAS domain S-box-containing protein